MRQVADEGHRFLVIFQNLGWLGEPGTRIWNQNRRLWRIWGVRATRSRKAMYSIEDMGTCQRLQFRLLRAGLALEKRMLHFVYRSSNAFGRVSLTRATENHAF